MRAASYSHGNHLTLLHRGAEFFPALIAACDAAQSEICVETYIFAFDITGEQVKAALLRAAARGVNVQVLVDWLGTGRERCARLQREFDAAGIHFASFNPWFRRGIARMHRKIVVIDRRMAFLGGLNLWVAHAFTTDTWVNFKLFGGIGLMVVFVLLQAAYLSRYMKEDSSS